MFLVLSAGFWEKIQEQPVVLAALISVTGVLLSSVLSYTSAYYANQRANQGQLRILKQNNKIRIEQENKFEKDRILRNTLQELTFVFYYQDYNPLEFSTYFNTPEGQRRFYEIMGAITAHGSQKSLQCIIMLQKAIVNSQLLSKHYDTLHYIEKAQLPFEVDWCRYETNALASIMIALLRHDISQESLDPKDILSVKYNNDNKQLKEFFNAGIDLFVKDLELEALMLLS